MLSVSVHGSQKAGIFCQWTATSGAHFKLLLKNIYQRMNKLIFNVSILRWIELQKFDHPQNNNWIRILIPMIFYFWENEYIHTYHITSKFHNSILFSLRATMLLIDWQTNMV